MFYSQFVLAKKGELGRIWLAAHWEKKLTKNQIFSTNIKHSVGHLLLGVVRIYSRKVKYLLDDCDDAVVKINMVNNQLMFEAFRPANINLEPGHETAKHRAITLDLDADGSMPDIDFEAGNFDNMGWEQGVDLDAYAAHHHAITDDASFHEDLPQSGPSQIDLPFDASHRSSSKGSEIGVALDEPLQQMDMNDVQGSIGGDGFSQQWEDDGAGFAPVAEFEEDKNVSIVDEQGKPQDLPEVKKQKRRAPKRRKVPAKVDKGDTTIPSQVMKERLQDTSPIVREFELAPASKRQMLQHDRSLLSAEARFNSPLLQAEQGVGAPHISPLLSNLLARNITPGGFDRVPAVPVLEAEAPGWGDDVPFDPGFGDDGPGNYEEFEPYQEIPQSPVASQEEEEAAAPESQEEAAAPAGAEKDEVWQERTRRMLKFLDSKMGSKPSCSYFDLFTGNEARKTVAGTFFELLVLKSRDYIELEQKEPYENIKISKTAHFHDPIPDPVPAI